MSINPILKAYMEDSDFPVESFDEDGNVEQVSLVDDSDEINKITNDIDDLSNAHILLGEVNEIQESNLDVLDSSNFHPVDGGFQEPLPENGDEAVSVIGDQIYKEQMIVENISGILGFSSDRNSSGTTKLYKALGVKTSCYSPKDIKLESFGDRNKRVKAISVYKSHCEGIMDLANKIGSSVIDGIKRLIEAIKNFITKLKYKARDVINKANDYLRKMQNTDRVYKKEVQFKVYEPNCAELIAVCENPGDYFENINIVHSYLDKIRNGLSALDSNEIDTAGRIFSVDILQDLGKNLKPLKFTGVSEVYPGLIMGSGGVYTLGGGQYVGGKPEFVMEFKDPNGINKLLEGRYAEIGENLKRINLDKIINNVNDITTEINNAIKKLGNISKEMKPVVSDLLKIMYFFNHTLFAGRVVLQGGSCILNIMYNEDCFEGNDKK